MARRSGRWFLGDEVGAFGDASRHVLVPVMPTSSHSCASKQTEIGMKATPP